MELGQKVARLESETRSLRDWCSDRFMSLWESTKGHDVNIVQALHNIHALQLEDNARQVRIQETAKNLESLLRMGNTAAPTSITPTTSTRPEILPPAEPAPPQSPTSQEDSEEEGEIISKKRPLSVGSEASTSKRQRK